MIEAPVEGTGKGLLAQVIGLVTTRDTIAVMTEAKDEDEWRSL